MNAGVRIKKERARLEYTQAAFAQACGVHRNTQIKYESGDREPDTSYLEAIAKIGVDVGYVLTGKSEALERQALWRVLSLIQENLKLTAFDEDLKDICQLAVKDNLEVWSSAAESPRPSTNAAVYNLLKKSPIVFFDTIALEDAIEKLEFVLETTGQTLPASQKARAIASLTHMQKTQGNRIDLKLIEAVIAASA